MAEIRAFRAFRYDLGRVGTLSDVVAPPYDVIDPALQDATDHLGVVSRRWPGSDQGVVSAVTGLPGPRPGFIADGHHRYETALSYREERRAAGEVRDDEAAANFVLMMLVSMSDPGLVI